MATYPNATLIFISYQNILRCLLGHFQWISSESLAHFFCLHFENEFLVENQTRTA